MSEKWNAHGRVVSDAVKRGAEVTANGVHHVTNFVARNDVPVADGAQALTQVVGVGLDKTGQALSAAGQQVSKTLHGSASRLADAAQRSLDGSGTSSAWRKGAGLLAWGLTKTVMHTAGLAANALDAAGRATAATGRVTGRSAPAVGGSVGGFLRGAAEVTSNAVDAAGLSASSIEAMRAQLRSLGQQELGKSVV